MILVVMNLIFHFKGNKWQKREREKKVLVWPNQWSQIKVNGWHQHKRGKPQIWDLESIETGVEDLDY